MAATGPARLEGPWLVADIGGTHARFGRVDDPSLPGLPVTDVATLRCADHDGPAAAARHYLALHPGRTAPTAAAFAVATAVTGDHVAMTNSGWAFSCAGTAAALGLAAERLRVLNDFEALALALPRLSAAQRRSVGRSGHGNGHHGGDGASRGAPRAAMAVVGPGTGLGVGGIVPVGAHGWIAVPGEGGHATLAAVDDEEAALLAAARRRVAHASAERLLSGIGLPLLYAVVAERMGMGSAHTTGDGPLPDAPAIVQRGVAGDDAVARRTLEHFCALLGSFTGGVALTLGARGGVFIGGGIVPRMAEFFAASRFRERFEAKGRFEPYLRAVPTFLITDTLAALTGAAAALADGDSDGLRDG